MIQDAGGVELLGGGRMRTGLVYRISGALAGPGELAELKSKGLQTVVDLRSEQEDRSSVIEWASAEGVRYANYPIVVGNYRGDADNDFVRAVTDGSHVAFMEQAYAQIATSFGPQMASGFERLSEGLPAGFGCAAGKDRTGVMNAMLHILLGASEETAIAAYLERAPSVAQLTPQIGRLFGLEDGAEPTEGMLHVMSVSRGNMESALAALNERGGVEAFLRSQGLSDGALARLRESLIEPS